MISHLVYTWTNRQNEWYNSERRFIFTCKSDAERKKWMTAIRLAVIENDERLRKERAQVRDANQYQSEERKGQSNNQTTVNMQQAFMLQQHQLSKPASKTRLQNKNSNS